MPKPKKQKSPKKPKKAPAKKGKGMHQTVKVSVRVREGAGGGGAAPIVYATYAPTPPAQPTQFTFDDGMPPAPVKRGPAHHRSTGVADKPSSSSTGTQADAPRIRFLPPGNDQEGLINLHRSFDQPSTSSTAEPRTPRFTFKLPRPKAPIV